LNSINFLPVAGVQLAALETKDELETFFNGTVGSCHDNKSEKQNIESIENTVLNKRSFVTLLFTYCDSGSNSMHSSKY
jgi:hypothetical protein